LTLDVNTGELIVKNFALAPHLIKEDFIQSKLFNEVKRENHYGYSRYELKTQMIVGEMWAIFLYFNRQQLLEMISLSLVGNETESDWEDWSEEKELEKKAKHDSWLMQRVGNPPYKYRWGDIASEYDSRSGSSTITIRYY
jgi:hypothetical protein